MHSTPTEANVPQSMHIALRGQIFRQRCMPPTRFCLPGDRVEENLLMDPEFVGQGFGLKLTAASTAKAGDSPAFAAFKATASPPWNVLPPTPTTSPPSRPLSLLLDKANRRMKRLKKT